MTEPTASIVHTAPIGCSSAVPCCGEQVFDLPRTDRMTTTESVTCPGPAEVTLLLGRDDATELLLILTEERYRLDKGDDRPVPQPRWGTNVRISQAVQAALNPES